MKDKERVQDILERCRKGEYPLKAQGAISDLLAIIRRLEARVEELELVEATGELILGQRDRLAGKAGRYETALEKIVKSPCVNGGLYAYETAKEALKEE
ncbi:MAG: hypothetical protein KAJ19_16495 [Gammaproteobacteria bacterium]|nr:hypothetical protein [Gammaproteobacteria bacterium]